MSVVARGSRPSFPDPPAPLFSSHVCVCSGKRERERDTQTTRGWDERSALTHRSKQAREHHEGKKGTYIAAALVERRCARDEEGWLVQHFASLLALLLSSPIFLHLFFFFFLFLSSAKERERERDISLSLSSRLVFPSHVAILAPEMRHNSHVCVWQDC